MRLLKIAPVTLVLGVFLASLLGCGSEPDEAETIENQIAAVQRGSITVDITAAGNLALSLTEDLAVDLFYPTGTKGTIGEVLVEEGDSVQEGQVLVTLDKDEWDDQLNTLEDDITSKERALTQAQANFLTARQTLEGIQDTTTKEKAVLNAEVSLQQSQESLDAAITETDYLAARATLNRAQNWYDYVLGASRTAEDPDSFLETLRRAEEQLKIAQTQYDNALSGYNSQEVAKLRKQVEIAKLTLASAQKDLDDVPQDIALQEIQVALNKGKVADAEKALTDAREKLEEAQSKSPEIKAPFDGFITTVNVAGGDEVLNGTVAVSIADPQKFEADILVSEMDILQVKLGTEALVEVDAMQGMALPAEVTHIAPTATIQSGVVNYKVKVELQSLEAVVPAQQQTGQKAMADIAAGEIPEPLQRAIDEGRITREQAEEMIKQGPPAGMTLPPGMEVPPGMPAAGQEAPAASQVTAAVPEDFQLREGLTVTVTIIVDERNDVLLVPNAAVTTEGGQSYVQVVTASGETEQLAIQTGINDYQFTEVTEGLSEGEQIIVPQGTVTTTTTSQQEPPRIGLFGPRPPR